MTEDELSKILLQGAKVWNAWREHHREQLSFARPFWYNSPGPSGKQVKGRNRLDFSEMIFSGVSIIGAFAEGLNLRNAIFENAHFEEGDFSRADFTGARFLNTKFNKTILTGANFDDTTFLNCNLNRINLAGASFRVKEITETVVYGLSAWDLQTNDQMKQSKLVIERTYELYSDIIRQGKVPLMVDDIELAQFVYYLNNNKKMRDMLNVLNAKCVLLLGRFKEGGLERLYSIRDYLGSKGYMAMIFDFERPDNMSLIETVVTMAGLSKFVIADLSGASVSGELASIFSQITRPMLVFGDVYATFSSIARKTDVFVIKNDGSELLLDIEARLPDLEGAHAKRIVELMQDDVYGG